MAARRRWQCTKTFSGRRYDCYFVQFRRHCPHLSNKAFYPFGNTDFYLFLCILSPDSSQKMMSFIRFISTCYRDTSLSAVRYLVKCIRQRTGSAAVPHICTQCDTNGQRLSQLCSQHIKIAHSCHNVIFLENRSFIRYKIKIF